MKLPYLQYELPYDWRRPVFNHIAFLKPRSKMNGWEKDNEKAVISSLARHQSINGGKLMVYRNSRMDASGYMIVNGYDELDSLFEILK